MYPAYLKSKKPAIMILTICLLALLLQSMGPASSVSAAACINPVSYFGEMKTSGNRIHGSKTNQPMMVKGSSFFWSNWSQKFYNAATVNRMVDEFQVEIVRASYGIDSSGNPYDPSDEARVGDLVNAAVARGVYVIIDWHAHEAHLNVNAAKSFFSRMAQQYGSYDNVIFEIYNEPTQVSWSTVKSYAEQVIPVIRQHSDNLIVVGSPTWSQDVDQAANNPITSWNNIAYTLHFYAGTHFQYLRDKADYALSRGIPLFVTEMGFVNADGDGAINYGSTTEWMNWMNQNNISWAHWAVNDKAEGSSIFNTDGSLTATGNHLKSLLANHATTAKWRQSNACGGNGSTPPTNPTNPSVPTLPGKIEAENFIAMNGIETGSTQDTGGGLVVGYVDPGDWMDYKVNVQSAGNYTFQFRATSAVNSGRFELRSGQNVLAHITVPNTGGWENWQNLSTNVYLPAGEQTLRIYATGGGFNLNWFQATKN